MLTVLLLATAAGIAAYLFTRPCPARITCSASPRIKRIVDRSEGLHAPFRPVPWLRFGFLQTVAAATRSVYQPPRGLSFDRELFALSDGGQVALDWARPGPAGLSPEAPVAIVLHGLTGSSRETYVMRFCCEALRRGWRPVVMVMRGSGGMALTNWRPYTAGDTCEVRESVRALRERYPRAPLVGAGYSLGGNVLARYVCEEGANCELAAAACVSPPTDLVRSGEFVNKPGTLQHYLCSLLGANLGRYARKHAEALAAAPGHAGVDLARAQHARTIREYDEALIAPMFGFAGAAEYYAAHSCGPLLQRARAPLLMLMAEDDLTTGPHTPAVAEAAVAEGGEDCAVVAVRVAHGGHVAFLEGALRPSGSWADRAACDFLQASLEDVSRSR